MQIEPVMYNITNIYYCSCLFLSALKFQIKKYDRFERISRVFAANKFLLMNFPPRVGRQPGGGRCECQCGGPSGEREQRGDLAADVGGQHESGH
jgi:hypothetical protein